MALTGALLCSPAQMFIGAFSDGCSEHANWTQGWETDTSAISEKSGYTYIEAADWCKSSRCVSAADEGEGSKLNNMTVSVSPASENGSHCFIYTERRVIWPCRSSRHSDYDLRLIFLHCWLQKTKKSRCYISMPAAHCTERRKCTLYDLFVLSFLKIRSIITLTLKILAVVLSCFLFWA